MYHANSASTGDNNTAYDPLGRLAAMRRGTLSSSGRNGTGLDTVATLNATTGVAGNQKAWTLDALGNWNSVTTDGTGTSHTTNGQNETTSVGATGLTYDNNGNLTKNAQAEPLRYDAWNRMVSSVYAGTTYLFTYDAMGRMATYKSGSGAANPYFYDWRGGLIQFGAGSSVANQYVRGVAYVNEIILRDRASGSGNSYGIAGGPLHERIYDQQDVNWNTTSLYQASGTPGVVERLVYDPYGTVTTLWCGRTVAARPPPTRFGWLLQGFTRRRAGLADGARAPRNAARSD